MSIVTRATIDQLLSQTRNLNLSIFIPTHIRGEEGKQDPIRLKNMLQTIRRDLETYGWKEDSMNQLFENINSLIDDRNFWLHQNRGLAIYSNPEYFEYFKLPLTPSENYYLSKNFLITPLLQLKNHHEPYHILALSQSETRLFSVSPEEVSQIPISDVPTSMIEHLKYHEVAANMQQHTGAAFQAGGYHGQGPDFHENKELILFLKHIEKEVTKYLKKQNRLLILAGLDKLTAAYKKINSYKHILDQAISGNADIKGGQQLADESWKYAEPYFRREIDESLNQFHNLNANGSASADFADVVKSAYFGKVDTLFVSLGQRQWGFFDEENNEVHLINSPNHESRDLVNFAAVSALKNGSTLYGLNSDEMPANAALAAIYRYKT